MSKNHFSFFIFICMPFLCAFNTVLLAQETNSPIIISEFLAANDDILLDKDGDSSDWVELFNKSNKTVSLEGWHLTDNMSEPYKWQFPKISIAPGEFLVVFASGKDLRNPEEELHTNFKLYAEGESLALIQDNGITIASQFKPPYAEKQENISYGYPQTATSTILLNEDTPARFIVPNNDSLGQTWTGNPSNEPFNDSNWDNVTSSIGYDRRNPKIGTENLALIATATQSSEFGGFPANFVNDGNYDNFTHTANGDITPWLEMDFGVTQTFGAINLFNRTNCCQDRLYNIVVEILNIEGAIVFISDTLNPYNEGETPISPGSQLTLNILDFVPQGVSGSKIRIKKTPISGTREYLTLAEVEVFGIEENYSDISSDIEDTMFGINASAYLRIPFNVNDENTFNALLLKIKYDDGFVAYLNGTQVASENAPTEPSYNEVANKLEYAEDFKLFSIDPNLLQKGTNILAIHGLNLSDENSTFLINPELEGLKITTDFNNRAFFPMPTPGDYNGTGLEGIVKALNFDYKRGFYEAPFQLVVSNSTPGSHIIYTTDGSDPSDTNGTKVLPRTSSSIPAEVISIDSTTVVRAIAAKDHYKSTEIETNTYIFLQDVITSDVMDKNITEDPSYKPLMEDALKDLPTVSIAINPETVNNDIDVFASLEWMTPNNEIEFQENMGIKYFGGAFTNFAKKNFRLFFKKEYGASKLRFPIFEGHENGIEPVSIFDQLELRAGSHDMVMRGFYMSNRFTDDTMLDMGNLNPHGQFVHLYINGVYWGQYHLRERWNADMHAQYLGGEKEDYEAINGNKNVGGWTRNDTNYDGDGSAWERVSSLRENYNGISPYLDVANYIDFMLLYMFGNSENEYRTVGPITEGSGFKFYLNDADGFLRNTGNRTVMDQPGQKHADGPRSIFSMLFKESSPKYRTLLADRIHKHFFNDGALTPEKIEARLLERCNQVEKSIIAESARWGYRTPESWETAKNNYITNIAPNRTSTVIEQFRNAGFYPSIEAPEIKINEENHYGGNVNSGDMLSLTAADGDIYYTLDGSDPYIPGDTYGDFITLFEENAQKTVFVPQSTLPSGWNVDANFDDSSWISGSGSFGYERSNGNTIDIDVENDMYNKQTSCLARIKFNVENLEKISKLYFYLSYDDGAIIYLNGKEIVKVNAPSGTPSYDFKALSGSEAAPLATFNITEYLDDLKTGVNLIAIHGVNVSTTSSDFYISAKMIANTGQTTDEVISPSAIKYGGEIIEINETTEIKTRATSNGEWSALSNVEFLVEKTEIEADDYLNVLSYPNPFNNNINIKFKTETDLDATLIIYDAMGRIVYNKEFPVEADEVSLSEINASSWNNGLYIYQLKLSDGSVFFGKIIRERR